MRWRPAHEAHAIELSSATFQFGEPVPAKLWLALLEDISTKASSSGFNVRFDGVEFGIEFRMPPATPELQFPGQVSPLPSAMPGGVVPLPIPSTDDVPTGRILRATDGGGFREQLQLHRGHFTYTLSRYVGWSSFADRVRNLLAPALDRVLQLVNLSIVKLEYWDRFIFAGPASEAKYDELLRVGSCYLPGFPADTTELWHSHVGLFVPSGTSSRRLINLNVDVIDLADSAGPSQPPVPQRSVSVYSMAQDALPPGNSPGAYDEAACTLDDLHGVLKKVFAEVITSEAAQRIALTLRLQSDDHTTEECEHSDEVF